MKKHSIYYTDKRAFTLAEVLITLGIIGVVAALTLPTLMAKYRKHVVVTKLQKIYSVMNQAINMSNAEYGDVSGWVKDCGISITPTCTLQEAKDWFNMYIGKHLEIVKIEDISLSENSVGAFRIYLKDGGILQVNAYLYDMTYYINSKAIENKQNGINTFGFRFNPVLLEHQKTEGWIRDTKTAIKPTFEPYTVYWDGTREQLIEGSNYSCGGKYHTFCAKLIQVDGWRISKDYPLKF